MEVSEKIVIEFDFNYIYEPKNYLNGIYLSIETQALESFLKKCQNITKVNISTKVKSKVLSLKGSIECFKHLDIDYYGLTEDFFANIDSFVPNLQSLRIQTEKRFSDSFIDSFHSMKNMQIVKILINDYDWGFGVN